MHDRLQAHGCIYELRPDAPAGRAPAATRVRFADRQAALRFLRGVVAGDPAGLRALRRTLAALPAQSDSDVLEALAAALASSRLRVYARPRVRPVFARRDPIEAPVEPVFDPPPVAPVSVEAPPPELPPEFLEPATQAQALREAAADGVPFCEECEKARRAQPSAPPPLAAESEEVARVDAAAQAQALREAARAGLPFCEECEKARRAQPSAPPPPSIAEEAEEDDAAQIDAATQASALRTAAASGAPFCEECEKARQAQAKGRS
jgi:hypothetical protein